MYAAPEGNEVATYTRGTARLKDGEARVSLDETFGHLTNPDIGLTAHLTPRGRWSELYVKSLTPEELVVASHDATSEALFDYLVYGLRIGFEEVSIVQEKQEESYIPSMEDHRELYARRPDLQQFNSLERFKKMRTNIGVTEALDLSASSILRDSIEEFDASIHDTESSYPDRQMKLRLEEEQHHMEQRRQNRALVR